METELAQMLKAALNAPVAMALLRDQCKSVRMWMNVEREVISVLSGVTILSAPTNVLVPMDTNWLRTGSIAMTSTSAQLQPIIANFNAKTLSGHLCAFVRMATSRQASFFPEFYVRCSLYSNLKITFCHTDWKRR